MRRHLLGIAACFLSTTLLAADPPASTFRAGAATSNITPALGSAIIGGFLPFPATNVHDELHARCLVLDDGKTKLALVVVDLLGFHYIVSHQARKFIEQETGIPATNVLISAIGSLPNEIFCEIGLEFRQRSPVQPAFLVSLAHGYFDYLPTPKQHELGGYETWLATNRLDPNASEKMLGALLEMAAEVHSTAAE